MASFKINAEDNCSLVILFFKDPTANSSFKIKSILQYLYSSLLRLGMPCLAKADKAKPLSISPRRGEEQILIN